MDAILRLRHLARYSFSDLAMYVTAKSFKRRQELGWPPAQKHFALMQ